MIQHYVIKFVSDLWQVGCFSPGTPVSSINKTDRHDITEILLKLALNTITLTLQNNANKIDSFSLFRYQPFYFHGGYVNPPDPDTFFHMKQEDIILGTLKIGIFS